MGVPRDTMGVPPNKFDLPLSEIARICQYYQIREMGLFGSVARGEADPTSDLDIFVEFEPGFHPGLGWFDLEEDLERLAGCHVDLSQKSLLKPRVRQSALREAVILYAA